MTTMATEGDCSDVDTITNDEDLLNPFSVSGTSHALCDT